MRDILCNLSYTDAVELPEKKQEWTWQDKVLMNCASVPLMLLIGSSFLLSCGKLSSSFLTICRFYQRPLLQFRQDRSKWALIGQNYVT